MIKKVALGVLILLAICSILLVGQIKVATYLFDHKLDSALTRVERKIPGVQLSYEPTDSSFTKRKGRLYYEVPLKAGNSLGVASVSGAVDLEVLFGPLKVSGALHSVSGVGNLEEIFGKFKVDPIAFNGAFKATAVTPKLEGTLKSESFMLPLEQGLCKFGQNALTFRCRPSLKLGRCGLRGRAALQQQAKLPLGFTGFKRQVPAAHCRPQATL